MMSQDHLPTRERVTTQQRHETQLGTQGLFKSSFDSVLKAWRKNKKSSRHFQRVLFLDVSFEWRQ